MGRVLGGVRLSRMTDGSTSPERQREQIATWAKLHGHEVAHVTEDTDVSGAMPAEKRPGLGPYLTSPALMRTWDILVVAKLDRCTRSVSDLCDLIDYCNANNKVLVSIADSFDLGTPAGRMVATILASVAQFERERIAERRREAADHLRKKGRYRGGVVPYGYMAEELPGGGWQLMPDPEEAEVVRWAADQVISGRSLTSLCAELTGRGVPTSRGGGVWRDTSLGKILRSPMLIGQIPYNGNVIRDDDGVVVRRDPILDDETWARLQAALARGSKTRAQMRSSAMIGVLFCELCDGPMWIQRRTDRPTSYYRCQKATREKTCDARMIPVEPIEDMIITALMDKCGDVEMGDEVPSEDHSAELDAVQEAIDNMENQLVSGEISAATWGRAVARLEKRLTVLQAEQAQAAEPRWVATGKTFAQTWAELDEAGRRALLVTNSVRAHARRMETARDEDFVIPIHFHDLAHTEDSKDDIVIVLRGDLEATLRLGNLDRLRKRLAQAR